MTDHGDGTGTLRLAPDADASQACGLSRLRVLATDTDNPALADAVTIEVQLFVKRITLPVVVRAG